MTMLQHRHGVALAFQVLVTGAAAGGVYGLVAAGPP